MRLMLECDPTPFFCVICISPKIDKVDSLFMDLSRLELCRKKVKYLHTAMFTITLFYMCLGKYVLSHLGKIAIVQSSLGFLIMMIL